MTKIRTQERFCEKKPGPDSRKKDVPFRGMASLQKQYELVLRWVSIGFFIRPRRNSEPQGRIRLPDDLCTSGDRVQSSRKGALKPEEKEIFVFPYMSNPCPGKRNLLMLSGGKKP